MEYKIKCKNCKQFFITCQCSRKFCSLSCSSSFNNKNRKLSKEILIKITNCLTHGNFNHKEDCKCFICRGKRGERFGEKRKKLTKEQKIKRSIYSYWKGKRGKDTAAWKGGVSPLNKRIRSLPEYKQWLKNIFKRDNYTCQKCGKRNCYLEAHHHIKSFSVILSEFLSQYSQFNSIEDKETLVRLAITYAPFWDIDNGKTLCKKCHNKTRGRKNV